MCISLEDITIYMANGSINFLYLSLQKYEKIRSDETALCSK